MRYTSKKNFHISHLYITTGSFIVGAVVGVLIWFVQAKTGLKITHYIDLYISPFGIAFIKMLEAIVIPLVFFTLLAGAANLKLKKFGRIGSKVIAWYLVTSFIAAIVGTAFAFFLNPGSRGLTLKVLQKAIPAQGIVAPPAFKTSFTSLILNIFDNPFNALSNGNFLPIVVFAIVFGLALRIVLEHTEDKRKKVKEDILHVMSTINEVLFLIVDWIMIYAPVGIFALSVVNFSELGPQLAKPYFFIGAGVIAGIILMITVVYSAMILIMTKTSPLRFFKAAQEVMITGFATRSSAATLPVALESAIKNLKIKKELAEFSLPLGATINMDGVCIHLPMFAVLAANVFGIHLDFSSLFLLVLATVLAAIGAGGVPGGSIMLLFLVLKAMGIDETNTALVVAFALGINPILDMFETLNNTTGDFVCTYVVASREKMIER